MAFAIDFEQLDSETKKKIYKDLTVKAKKSQFNNDPAPFQVFEIEEESIYIPLRKYKEYLGDGENSPASPKDSLFPHHPSEYDRINLEFTFKLYTKETDPSGRGRDQDVLITEAIKQLNKNHTTFVSAFTGYGKCLAPGTEVLMYDGTKKKVENILLKDKIMGDDSTSRNILSVCEGVEEMFEIIPKLGESFTVNRSHILTVFQNEKEKNLNSYHKDENVIDISVEDYLKLSDEEQQNLKCFWVPVNYPHKNIEFDPYFLGVWFGNNSEYSIKDSKIFDCIQCDSVLEARDKTDIIFRKCIPLLYKVNSEEIRLNILAGLIDSCGKIKENGYEIVKQSKELSNDIQDLCRSLGLFCFITKKNTFNFSTSITLLLNDTYHISIYGDNIKNIPIRVESKKIILEDINDIERENKYNPLITDFTVISKGGGKYYGFQIDKNGRFLLGSHMVTHNTMTGTYLLCHYGYKTMILCHNDTIKEQWKEEIIKFTGGKAKVQIVKGNKAFDPTIDVYIIGIQKAVRLEREAVMNIGMVIIDEAHICTTTAFTKSLLKFQPMFVVGLSATPERVDGLHTLLELHFGPKKEFIKREEIKDFTVIKYKTKYKPIVSYQIVYGQATLAWTNMMSSIADIKERWIEIAEIAISEPNHKIILLCDRKEMATSIYEYLLNKGEDAELLIGTKKTWDKTKRILVAGVKKGGVGLNDPSLTMLIVAADMKNVKQCEGRIRTTNNVVYDIVDDYKTFESHWSLREKWYLKRGATILVGGSNKPTKPLFKEPTRFLKPN
jgi:hypothetical protein